MQLQASALTRQQLLDNILYLRIHDHIEQVRLHGGASMHHAQCALLVLGKLICKGGLCVALIGRQVYACVQIAAIQALKETLEQHVLVRPLAARSCLVVYAPPPDLTAHACTCAAAPH